MHILKMNDVAYEAVRKKVTTSAVTIPLLPISIDIDRYFQKYRDIDIDILSQ